MKRTPQYGLAYGDQGDLYSASADLDRNIVIDNQLLGLSSSITDGVMDGWTLSPGTGLNVNVSPGSGFITKIFHKTFSRRVAALQDNSVNYIYMQSRMLNNVGGLTIEAEGPRSLVASATLLDSTPPATPTPDPFTASAVEFDIINLSWHANTESDFDHYNIYRSTGGPYVLVGSPKTNGILLKPYQDIGLSPSTHYYYRITAVDLSNNESSGHISANTSTPNDSRVPPEVGGLFLYPSNGQISIVYASSTYASSLLLDYYITVDKLGSDGSILSTSSFSNGTALYHQLTGVDNSYRYRITVSVRTIFGITSNGTSADAIPFLSIAPLEVVSPVATSGIKSITLSWSPSPTSTGTSIGQKNKYLIRIIKDGVVSFPIDVGLSTSRKITSYTEATTVGAGLVSTLKDSVEYTFRISCLDSFGNESSGAYVKAFTIDSTTPNDPRSVTANGLDGSIAVNWTHSSSPSVAGYNIAIDTGSGFGSDIILGYIQAHVLTGLTNGTFTRIRIKTRSRTNILSPGTIIAAIPVKDVIPPIVPTGLTTTAKDTEVIVSWNKSKSNDFSYFTLKRIAVKESPNVPREKILTPVTGIGPSSGELVRNVGNSVSLLDTDLVNGQTYAYYIRATDTANNSSEYSPVSLVQPYVGLSQLSRPILSIAGGSSIVLSWTPVIEQHTAYNIYRSANSVYGFEYVASTSAGTTTITESNLPGRTYYYQVSAVLDNADVIVDTGSVQPPNSVLLGSAKTVSGSVVNTTNVQRIIQNLDAVIREETIAKLLAHHHSVSSVNKIKITTISLLAMIDAVNVSGLDLTKYQLSSDAVAYYNSLAKDASGTTIKYDQGRTFFVSPSSVIGDIPFVGDYQLLVSGAIPTSSFSIDHNRNCIISSEVINQTNPVTLSGNGLSYYVPASMDNGFSIYVDGVFTPTPSVDTATQTIRFPAALAPEKVVTVVIEPLVPDYSGTFGSRQVSLSPSVVLNDFSTTDNTSFRSASGSFDGTDVFFVLVNGNKTNLSHAINTIVKAIVFDNPLPPGTNVSLLIANREEVQQLLPKNMFGNIDATQITKGRFIKPQLPAISHQGRIGEVAYPKFEKVTSLDRYEYYGTSNQVGTGTTPYAFFSDDFGQLTIGTSNGVLRTSGFDSFVSGSDSSNATVDSTVNVNGITINRVSTDDIVKSAKNAQIFSGRYNGVIPIVLISGGKLYTSRELISPSLTLMDDGRVLISGGEYYNDNRGYYFETTDAWIYNPETKAMSQTGSMNAARVSHAAIRLPNGNIMISGGARSTDLAYGQTFEVIAATFSKLKSCEIFDIASQKFITVPDMATTRSNHGFTLLSQTQILVSGGQVTDTWFDDRSKNNSGPAKISKTCEIYDIDAQVFSPTTPMNRERSGHSSKLLATGTIVVENKGYGSELFRLNGATWTLVGAGAEQTQTVLNNGLAIDAIDGIVKSFFRDSSGILYAVTRNGIFYAPDSETFSKMKGLETVGVVHAIAEANKTLFAATDLGVYEITPDIKAQYTWFQGGLIGAGTTETFDLIESNGIMFAGTEIGIFKTVDSGETWTSLNATYNGKELEDIYNIDIINGRTLLQSSDGLYYSDNLISWNLIGRFTFLSKESRLATRSNDIFVASPIGLWASRSGSDFTLVDFDRNRNTKTNNVSMIGFFGTDIIVGYDNEMYAVGLDMRAIRLAQFVGTIPTIRINGIEARSGFRYDNQRSRVIFEFKRLFSDVIEIATDYQNYFIDSWYGDAPDAPVTVFSDGKEQDFTTYVTDPRLGLISFFAPRDKSDIVKIDITNVSIDGAGEFFHDELEDRLSMDANGLTLSMEHDRSCNLLQFGLSMEHNFLERGLERNQYYCMSGHNVDRGLTSFLINSEFYIIGRRDFDRFNSTIDYVLQSKSDDPGQNALVPLSMFEHSISQLWVGTENGIFILDPSDSFSVSPLFPGNQINGIMSFSGKTWLVTDTDVVTTSNGIDFVTNDGNGLPESLFCIGSIAGIPILGTNDGIYYSDDQTSQKYDPDLNKLVASPFSVWFKAVFSDTFGKEIPVSSPCRVLITAQGTAYAAIDDSIFFSIDGKSWIKAYQFSNKNAVSCMAYFSYKLYVGTVSGLWTDNNTVRSKNASMTLEKVQNDTNNGSFSVNDICATPTSLLAVGNRPYLYTLNDGDWTRESIPDLGAAHKVFYTSSGKTVVLSNDTVLSK